MCCVCLYVIDEAPVNTGSSLNTDQGYCATFDAFLLDECSPIAADVTVVSDTVSIVDDKCIRYDSQQLSSTVHEFVRVKPTLSDEHCYAGHSDDEHEEGNKKSNRKSASGIYLLLLFNCIGMCKVMWGRSE
jgi:hypothetical protein